MFTAAECGLTLLSDIALDMDLLCHESLHDYKPGPKSGPRTRNRKVTFDITDSPSVFFWPGFPLLEEAEAIASLLIEEGTPSERQYDRWLSARLDQADFNHDFNRKCFRYGSVSPVSVYNKETAPLYDAPVAERTRKDGHLLRAARFARQEEALAQAREDTIF
tara:strand:- start:71 stop:559 length:489 start_codon:yes stop_codon:yes gene_type:complete